MVYYSSTDNSSYEDLSSSVTTAVDDAVEFFIETKKQNDNMSLGCVILLRDDVNAVHALVHLATEQNMNRVIRLLSGVFSKCSLLTMVDAWQLAPVAASINPLEAVKVLTGQLALEEIASNSDHPLYHYVTEALMISGFESSQDGPEFYSLRIPYACADDQYVLGDWNVMDPESFELVSLMHEGIESFNDHAEGLAAFIEDLPEGSGELATKVFTLVFTAVMAPVRVQLTGHNIPHLVSEVVAAIWKKATAGTRPVGMFEVLDEEGNVIESFPSE